MFFGEWKPRAPETGSVEEDGCTGKKQEQLLIIASNGE